MFKTQIGKIGLWAVIILVVAVYPRQVIADPLAIQTRLEEGVVLKVHLPKDAGEEKYRYAREVLQTACAAYKEVVFK